MPVCILRPFSTCASRVGMWLHMLLKACRFPASSCLWASIHKNSQLLTLLLLWRLSYSPPPLPSTAWKSLEVQYILTLFIPVHRDRKHLSLFYQENKTFEIHLLRFISMFYIPLPAPLALLSAGGESCSAASLAKGGVPGGVGKPVYSKSFWTELTKSWHTLLYFISACCILYQLPSLYCRVRE